MKLPIKEKFFDMILKGEKEVDLRDAHITFVCEGTGRTLQRKIVHTQIININDVPEHLHYLFEDERIIVFHLSTS